MATLNVKGFPEDLYKELNDQADSDRRSLSQEVIYLLQYALSELKKPSILELQGLGKNRWEGVNATEYIRNERNQWE